MTLPPSPRLLAAVEKGNISFVHQQIAEKGISIITPEVFEKASKEIQQFFLDARADPKSHVWSLTEKSEQSLLKEGDKLG